MIKKILVLSLLLGLITTHHTQTIDDASTEKAAMQILLALSEDIADLAIHAKSGIKDPQKTKQCAMSMVKRLMELIAAGTIIIIKHKKGIRIADSAGNDLSQEQMLELIVEKLS